MSSGKTKVTFKIVLPSYFKTRNKTAENVLFKLTEERPVEEQQKHIKIVITFLYPL